MVIFQRKFQKMLKSDASLSLIWAIRDIRGSFKSFALVLSCLVIGLSAITALQISAASVLGSISENSRTILGADWVIRQIYTPIGKAERDWLHGKGATLSETIEFRPMLINPETGDTTLVELKVVDTLYPLYGDFGLTSNQALQTQLKKGPVLDPTLQARLNLTNGSVVQLGNANFQIVDWIVNEPDKAGGGRFGLAPRVMMSAEDFKKTGLQNPGSLINYDLRIRWPEGKTPSLDEFKNAFPMATWRIQTHENASPQIQRFVNNVLQFLTLVGLSALLIGGIGISNGLRAYFETRLTSIAIYKMIGTPNHLVRKIYFWQIGFLTVIGIILGLALGSLIPWLGLSSIQNMLPFPIELKFSLGSLIIPTVFGLLTIWLFALWPLGQAELASPLLLFRRGASIDYQRPKNDIILFIIFAALALSFFIFETSTFKVFSLAFIIGAFLCFIIFYGLGFLIIKIASRNTNKAPLPLRLALTNLSGPRNATILTLISIGIGLTVLASVTLIDRNMRGILSERMPKDAPSFFFLDVQPNQKNDFKAFLENWPNASNLVMTPNLRGRIKSVNGVPAAEALIDTRESWLLQNDRGFTYTTSQPAHSLITSGEWWPKDYNGPPLISVVDDIQKGFGVKVGDEITVTILGRDITAKIANIREVNWTSFTINFAITFAPGTLEGAPHSWLATVIAPPDSEAQLQRAISKSFPNISMVRVTEAIESVQNILDQLVTAIRVMTILCLLTGIFVLVGALGTTRLQRSYDTVILKVMGTPQSLILKSLSIEFILLGLCSTLLAGFFGIAVSWGVMEPLMDLGWVFYPLTSIIIISAGFMIIFATGLLSLYTVLSRPVMDFLRNE